MPVTTTDGRDWPLAVGGDHASFGRIFDRHADSIYRFVNRRLGDAHMAEELTSQTFLELWRQRDRVTLHQGSLRPWLHAVARNHLNRHWRSVDRGGRAVRRLEAVGFRAEQSEGLAEQVTDEIDSRDRCAEVMAVLGSIPEHQREVLLLWAWEQLTYDEIAVVLDVPVGTVRSRLARARAQLKKLDGTADGSRAYPGCSDELGEPRVPQTMGRRQKR